MYLLYGKENIFNGIIIVVVTVIDINILLKPMTKEIRNLHKAVYH